MPESDPLEPRREYTERLAARRATLEVLNKKDSAISSGRLWSAVAGVVGYFVLANYGLQYYWIPIPAILFFILLIFHSRVRQQIRPLIRAIQYYEQCQARIDSQWAGKGNPGAEYMDSAHPYSADLDLFGSGSLFELLCTAQTRAGETTLAKWLLAPAASDEVTARQEAVKELRGCVDLRERLAILGGEVRENIRPEKLDYWGRAPRTLFAGATQKIAILLTAITLITIGIWVFNDIGRALFLVNACLIFGFGQIVSKHVHAVNDAVENTENEMAVLARILAHLEKESFSSAKLVALQNQFKRGAEAASESISILLKRIRLLDAQRNKMFAIPSFIFLWPVHFAFAFENWREKHGASVGGWLDAVGEIEALCALSGYAYDHPKDAFPEVGNSDGAPRFEGCALGHPLLSDSVCVRNDVRIGGKLRVLIVSGSNMSGKSTLLRTVGINVVLALAGAPVRAASLSLCPLAIGATLRVQDSLQAGTSRFYAEIARLRQLVDLADGKHAMNFLNGKSGNAKTSPPLFFLLDEILHGTNSHDRHIGAELIVTGLLDKGAIGLVTTHDLALANTVDSMGGRAANVHFDDTLKDGKLIFDYRMQDGVVKKSNAMELMRAIGLPV